MKSDAHGKTSLLLKPLVRALMNVRGTSAGFGLLALPALALAQMPTGGQVVAGSATISQPDANNMVINQGSNKAIINWQGFSIGSNGYVQFIQPGSTSIALNRVVGQDPSSILGRLSANGQVFLVNPNGVYFGANATVDVAGIVASTMNIRNEDFMRGDFRFQRDPNAPSNATVINAGSINANGGYVVLAGDYVSNTGLIQANLGTAMLASGSAMTLQMAGSSLVNYAIDEATLAHLAGVANAGQIMASGGKIIMTAEVANQLAGTVVNNSGLVQAQGTVEKDGAIYLTGKGGDVVNAGTLDVSGGQDGKAGQVHMRASGDLVHEAGSLITADGAKTGVSDGGSIDTWADGKNRFKEGATITARGGEEGGDGGFVELSGNSVSYRGDIDLLAKNGNGGTLLIDPKTITIKNGSGGDDSELDDDATFYEQNLESALAGSGDVVLLAQNSGVGNTASIHMEDLSDNILSGTGTAGLTLKVEASDGATGSITFQDLNDRIAIGGQLNLSVDNSAGQNLLPPSGVGSIDVGHLQSNTGIDVKAGSISAASMTVQREISTNTDTSYAIKARAYTGDLKVSGDVRVDVVNDKAASVSTEVDLKADNGAIEIGGDVVSNATGLGYYHYNWVTDNNDTAGNNATTYFGQQPWKIDNQGDHAISTKLSIVSGEGAASNITVGGAVQAVATDNNTEFATKGVGGYWQTATATTHNFWRPTAASAEATITAGGDVSIGGNTSVKADGYATSSYSEIESWRQMVDNFNYTSANQTVHTDYGCLSFSDSVCTGGYGYRDSYIHTVNNMKGSAKSGSEKYIWNFGPYTPSLPDSANNSPNVPTNVTDSTNGTTTGPMGYTGVRGLTAKLDISAGKSVTLNGVDVRATNRSATGSNSYTDSNWGHQDTANGLSNTASSFTSANRETDYFDTISTSYNSASTDAQVNITAGAGSAINLNGATNVVASHTDNSASNGTLDFAKLALLAGSGNGSQDSAININAPVLVDGSSDRSIDLTVRNQDGDIVQVGDGAAIQVKNRYDAGDASASFTSDNTNATLDAVTVTAGNAASVTAKAKNQVQTTGNISASASNAANVGVEATDGQLILDGSVTASAASATIDLSSGTTLTANGALASNGSGTAAIDINAGTDLAVNAAVTATANGGTGNATVDLSAGGSLTADADIKAIATQSQSTGNYNNWFFTGGNASVDLQSAGDMDLNQNVAANGYNSATMNVTSTAGTVDLAAGKTVVSQATGTAYDTQYYHYSHSASLNMTGQTGMNIHGNVTSSAAAGTASLNLQTMQGYGATIEQDAASTIKADGRAATLHIRTAADEAAADNMADANLYGTIAATASKGNAQLQVDAGHAWVKDFTATSSDGKGQATISTNYGNLTLNGVGTVSGNSNSLDGASLAINLSREFNAEDSSITVSNSNTGNTAGARAIITGGAVADDVNLLGALSVSGYASAQASLTAAGAVVANGAVNVTALGVSGSAQATLTSSEESLRIGGGASVNAKAEANGGNASVTLKGNTALTIDGNVLAKGTNQATVTGTSTGGVDAKLRQGEESEIKAAGGTATVTLNAGNASPTALNAADLELNGVVNAEATTGTGSLNLKGKSVSLHDLAASSTFGAADLQVAALDGTLTGSGTISATGSFYSTGATLGLSSSGDMDLSSAGITVNNSHNGQTSTASATLVAGGALTLGNSSVAAGQTATFDAASTGSLIVAGNVNGTARNDAGAANVSLNAQDGSLSVNADTTVSSTSGGSANTTLLATNGMQIDGNVSASGTTGAASTKLTTTGGVDATINQDALSTIATEGVSASTVILAGSATPDADNGAAFTLAGTLSAHAGSGLSQIDIQGKGGSVNDLTANSQSGGSKLKVGAVDGDLSLNGDINASGNRNSSDGVELGLNASGMLDTTGGTITVNNGNHGNVAGATATLTAGTTMNLGEISISAAKTSSLTATSEGVLTIAAALNSTATALDGSSNITLTSNEASVNLQADKTVTSTGPGSAVVAVTGKDGVQIDGDIVATATDGVAVVGVLTTGGALAGINQGSASTISADGMTAVIDITAGNEEPDATTAAVVDLAGLTKAHATDGLARIEVEAASATINTLQAQADLGNANVGVRTLDSAGSLVLNGSLQASGNADNDQGAAVMVEGAGSVNTDAATITVDNASTGEDALAKVSVIATGGNLTLGQITVTGQNAELAAGALADVATQGTIKVTGVNSAGLMMMSGGDLQLQSDVEVEATAGMASVMLMSSLSNYAGVTDDSDIPTPPGGNIVQGAEHSLVIKGMDAGAMIGAENGTVTLAGTVSAQAGTGMAQIQIAGKEVSVNDLTVSSQSGGSKLEVAALEGKLTLTGDINVSGNSDNLDGVELVLNATGALDTSGRTITVNNSSEGEWAGSSATLNAGTTMNLGEISVSGASASVNLSAVTGVQINGDISALATDGTGVISVSTTGGAEAGISQGSASTLLAEGKSARINITAGNQESDESTGATVNLAGLTKAHATDGRARIDIEAASGTINNLEATTDSGEAMVGVHTLDAAGTLTLNGTVQANANSGNINLYNNSFNTLDAGYNGATVIVEGAGAVDTSAAILSATDISTAEQGLATVHVMANGGNLTLGQVAATGQTATIQAGGLGVVRTVGTLTSTGVGAADISMMSGGDMELDSDLHAKATDGRATIMLMTADAMNSIMTMDDSPPSPSNIAQGANRSLLAEGNSAAVIVGSGQGKVTLAGNTTVNATEDASLMVGGTDVEVKNFSVESTNGGAVAQFMAMTGDIVANGAGSVTGAADIPYGARLMMDAQGAIDTRSATLSVANIGAGQDAGAVVEMTTIEGGIQAGTTSVTTDGGAYAGIGMMARGALDLTGDISAIATGNGTAAVQLFSGVENQFIAPAMAPMGMPSEPLILSGSITQSAGKLIKANSANGNATVELQTGNCCSGTINLAGALEAKVDGGEGAGTIDIRSDNVTLTKLTANSGVNNTGGTAINVTATKSITINGKVDLQAKNAEAIAGMTLVADTLNWNGGAATLSNNNAHIQLAAFDPNRIIGVESDQDFDAVPHTNYSQTMLKNFMGYGAEIKFGGEVDRSAFNHSSLKELVQQTADIHVAGNGRLDLGDVKMVFDTTGTVYYHDPKMSPWSVPAGRIAIYVARPNVDRYLDRTDNTLQNMTRALENSVFGNNSTPTVNPGGAGPVAGTTQVSGNLYMAGNGVNTSGVNPGNSGDAGNANSGNANPGNANPGAGDGGNTEPGNVDPTKREAGDQPQGAERKRDGEEDLAS
jgi:filamentous hemagglutinin family protein